MDPHHLIIVAFQTQLVPAPKFDLPAPYTCEVREYTQTSLDEIPERIRDAHVVTLSTLRLDASVLDPAVSPRLKMVAVVASGTDCIDLAACRARGVAVSNTPHCNSRSVAEHTIALYFDLRRSVTLSHTLTRAGQWPIRATLTRSLNGPDGRPPRTCRSETIGIVGYGALGKMIESIARDLGMKVLISGRKEESDAPEGRTPFDAVIKESTVIALCVPQTPGTIDLISEPEFAAMGPHALVINVSRAGIVNEDALIAALKARRIAGAAVDVYPKEPADPDSCRLLGPETEGLNLVTTPHVAWVAEDTNRNYQAVLLGNLSTWLTTGRAKNHVA